MEILNDKQVNERFLKAYKNRRHIANLNTEETIEVIELVEKKICMIEEHHSKVVEFNPQMKDNSIDNVSMGGYTHKQLSQFKGDLENHLSKESKTEQETIIDKIYILHFYKKFKSYFPDETKEIWLQRFIYPFQKPINPIKIESRVNGENNRLILLAILSEIYKCPHADFIYKDFVFDRFGIKAFHKAVSTHKDKPEFKKNSEGCRIILKDMTLLK
jgi:hypothetical protein